MTNKSLADLVPLAKSWIAPAHLQVTEGAVDNQGYDASQRAYVLAEKQSGHPDLLQVTLQASEASPVFHAALLVQGWGEDDVRVDIDGRFAEPGTKVRTAHLHHLDSTDLLIWIEQETTRPLRIELKPLPRSAAYAKTPAPR